VTDDAIADSFGELISATLASQYSCVGKPVFLRWQASILALSRLSAICSTFSDKNEGILAALGHTRVSSLCIMMICVLVVHSMLNECVMSSPQPFKSQQLNSDCFGTAELPSRDDCK